MTVVAWASLSAADQKSLLLSAGRSAQVGAELLDQSLNVVRDISSALLPGSGSVKWLAATADARDAVQTTATFTLSLASELAWGKDLVRLYKVVSDLDSGVSARGDLGVFMLPFPDRAAGSVTVADGGSLLLDWQLSCQDRSAQLDRIPGADYTAADGQTVLAAIKAALDAAGVTGYLIDGTNQAEMPTGGKPWPFAGGQQATWRTIVNYLAELIGYEPVYCGPSGMLRVGPAVDSTAAGVTQTLDVDTPRWVTPLGPQRTRKLDLSSVPNQWSVLWVDADGTAVTDAASPYTYTNQSAGAASVDALGGSLLGLRPAQQQTIEAASADDFTAQAQAIVAAAMRTVTEYDVSTVMWPELPHAPIFDLIDPDTTGTSEAVKTVATSAEIQLSDDDTAWTLQAVS